MHEDRQPTRGYSDPVNGSITAYLAWDHAEIMAMLDEIVALVDSRELEEADARYGKLQFRLLKHVGVEEDLVFPVWERRFGRAPGPTQVLRQEHIELTDNVRAMQLALEGRDADGFGVACRRFKSLLVRHKTKEETFLYPGIDAMLTPEARAELLRRMLSQ